MEKNVLMKFKSASLNIIEIAPLTGSQCAAHNSQWDNNLTTTEVEWIALVCFEQVVIHVLCTGSSFHDFL